MGELIHQGDGALDRGDRLQGVDVAKAGQAGELSSMRLYRERYGLAD